MCVYAACCRWLDSPFTIVRMSSKCLRSHRSPSCREDVGICEVWHLVAVGTEGLNDFSVTTRVCLVRKSPNKSFQEQESFVTGKYKIGLAKTHTQRLDLWRGRHQNKETRRGESCPCWKRKISATFWCLLPAGPKTPAAAGSQIQRLPLLTREPRTESCYESIMIQIYVSIPPSTD